MLLNFLNILKIFVSYHPIPYVASFTVHSCILWRLFISNAEPCHTILNHNHHDPKISNLSIAIQFVSLAQSQKAISPIELSKNEQSPQLTPLKNRHLTTRTVNNQSNSSSDTALEDIKITPYATNKPPIFPNELQKSLGKTIENINLILKLVLNQKGQVINVICLTPNIDKKLENHCLETAKKWQFHIQGLLPLRPIAIEIPIDFERL